MSDRTETLLAELVELQRRQLANQEEALAGQRHSIEAQSGAIDLQRQALQRQRNALRVVFTLIGAVLVMIVVPYAYAWLRYLSR